MEIKDLINLDMTTKENDIPEVNRSFDKLAVELEKLKLEKSVFNKIVDLISDYATDVENQGYMVGFDSALTLFTSLKHSLSTMNPRTKSG